MSEPITILQELAGLFGSNGVHLSFYANGVNSKVFTAAEGASEATKQLAEVCTFLGAKVKLSWWRERNIWTVAFDDVHEVRIGGNTIRHLDQGGRVEHEVCTSPLSASGETVAAAIAALRKSVFESKVLVLSTESMGLFNGNDDADGPHMITVIRAGQKTDSWKYDHRDQTKIRACLAEIEV
jgi:hypothetical protein